MLYVPRVHPRQIPFELVANSLPCSSPRKARPKEERSLSVIGCDFTANEGATTPRSTAKTKRTCKVFMF